MSLTSACESFRAMLNFAIFRLSRRCAGVIRNNDTYFQLCRITSASTRVLAVAPGSRSPRGSCNFDRSGNGLSPTTNFRARIWHGYVSIAPRGWGGKDEERNQITRVLRKAAYTRRISRSNSSALYVCAANPPVPENISQYRLDKLYARQRINSRVNRRRYKLYNTSKRFVPDENRGIVR